MIYSCFDAETGLYKYFEDSRTKPINADLPVPSFSTKTKLGIAAIDAARPLPSDARFKGTGWHARGIIVRCASGVSGLGSVGKNAPLFAFAVACAAMLGTYFLVRESQ